MGKRKDVQETVRDGLEDAAQMTALQLKGLSAWQRGKRQPVEIKNVITVDHSQLLVNLTKVLAMLAHEERQQIIAKVAMFSNMSDNDVEDLAVEAKKFLDKSGKLPQ